MSSTLHCDNCGAAVRPGLAACYYCHAALVLPASGAAAQAPGAAAGVPAGVVEALRRGNKIEAIKVYREATKSSLAAAKDAVDALERKLGMG